MNFSGDILFVKLVLGCQVNFLGYGDEITPRKIDYITAFEQRYIGIIALDSLSRFS